VASAAGAVALSWWLIPATVSIAGWSGPVPDRVALLAPLGRLWTGAAVAAVTAVAALWLARRRGAVERLASIAAPLSLLWLWAVPYLPWPSRAPLLLVFAGPVRWMVVAAAASAALVRAGAWERVSRVHLTRTTVFAVSLVIYAIFGLRFLSNPGLGGDQPHYLVIAHSLLVDRDLDIANNHERGDYRAFYAGPLRPDYLQRGRRGEIYSVHAPGLPALLVPAYAAGGARGAVLFVAALAALAAVGVFELALAFAGPRAATLAWAAICLAVPFVPHAWAVYPELPAALVVGWSALWIWRGGQSTKQLLLHGAMLAVLPWLHTKFVVLLAPLAVLQAARLRPARDRIAWFAAPIVVIVGGWLASFYWMYGTFDPQAPYGAFASANVSSANIVHGTLGLFFDQKFGLLVYAPAYALAIAGLGLMVRDRRTRPYALAASAVVVLFVASTTRFYMWWGGSSAPARFLVPVLPLLAPALAVAIERLQSPAGRAATAACTIASVAIGAAAALWPGDYLFSPPHGTSRLVEALQGPAPLTAWLPTFTEERWGVDAGELALWIAALGVVALICAAARRARLVRTGWGALATAVLALPAAAAALPGHGALPDRAAIAVQGQLALLHAYDGRLRVVDLRTIRRLPEREALSKLTLDVRQTSADPDSSTAGPFALAAGEYVARFWFGGDRSPKAEIRVLAGGRVVIARRGGPLENPALLPFSLPLAAPVVLASAGADLPRVQIEPSALAGPARATGLEAAAIEPIEGPPEAYVAYVDDFSYPEGGVYWTRGTGTSRVVLVPAGGRELTLILHVGSKAAAVAVKVGDRAQQFDLAANVALRRPGRGGRGASVARLPAGGRRSRVGRSAVARVPGASARAIACTSRTECVTLGLRSTPRPGDFGRATQPSVAKHPSRSNR